jgi:hypothetical protein
LLQAKSEVAFDSLVTALSSPIFPPDFALALRITDRCLLMPTAKFSKTILCKRPETLPEYREFLSANQQ